MSEENLSDLPTIRKVIIPETRAPYGQDRTPVAWIGKEAGAGAPPYEQFSGSAISHHLMTELGMWSDVSTIYRRMRMLGVEGTMVYLSKHTRPEGLAMHEDPKQAVKNAYRKIPAAFGAEAFILPRVTEEVAEELVKIMPDVVMSPNYDLAAKEIISGARQKTQKLRGLEVTDPLWQPDHYRSTEAFGRHACEERHPFFMPQDLQFNRENYTLEQVGKIESQATLALSVSALNYSNGTGYTNMLNNNTLSSDGGVGMREEGFYGGIIKALESSGRLELMGIPQGTISAAVSTDGFIFNRNTIDQVLSEAAIKRRKRMLADVPFVLYEINDGVTYNTTRAERRSMYKDLD
ncbi:hypothetical protein HN777_02325, partial [Candidatus Woesearchaeota archaeon]|nr:hypothetical protein [Candidatus Woesearchaeota archaeon]